MVYVIILLFFVAIAAGFIDTLAGGGGMITLPALLFAGISPQSAIATNKLQSSFGSISAVFYFWRQKQIKFKPILLGILFTIIGALLGVLATNLLAKDLLQKIIPILLIIMCLAFLLMPDLGQKNSAIKCSFLSFCLLICLTIGFYDGFLGPGAGSFFMLGLVLLQGKTLRQATIQAKVYNATSNITALIFFIFLGKIQLAIGIIMGIGQMIGAKLASNLVINLGNKLIRPIVIIISLIISLMLMYKYWY